MNINKINAHTEFLEKNEAIMQCAEIVAKNIVYGILQEFGTLKNYRLFQKQSYLNTQIKAA